jgi:hypothetical protein
MIGCQASRGPWVVHSPALLPQPGSLAPHVPTPRRQGLHFLHQCMTPLPQCLGYTGERERACGTLPHLLECLPERGDRARCGQPGAATLRQAGLVVRGAAVPREKHHPLAQCRRPLLHLDFGVYV